MQNFRKILTAQLKFHQICTLIGSFRWKYIKFQLRKYGEVISHDIEDWCKKNWFVFSKMTRIRWILIWALKSLQNLHFHSSLLWKVYNLWPKKCRWVISHDTEESCKIWRKTGLWFGKWYEEFSKFSPEHLKLSKIYTLMSCFWPKYKMFGLKK